MTRADIRTVPVPPTARIHAALPGADFHDAYEMPFDHQGRPALDIFMATVVRGPAWVDRLMRLRNRVVSRLGLKDLGVLSAIDPGKPFSAYRPGDRVGIFTLRSVSDEEVVVGDADRHLDVQVSLLKSQRDGQPAIVVSTVVHNRNLAGRLYMLVVAPVHRLIVPATMRQAAARGA